MFNDPIMMALVFLILLEKWKTISELEAYHKRIVAPYPAFEKQMKKKVGVHQMPAVVLPDGSD